jgi:hypothetical protein
VDLTEVVRPGCRLRAGAEVAELTGMLDLTGHLNGTRVIVRRERPHTPPNCHCSTSTTASAIRRSSPTSHR